MPVCVSICLPIYVPTRTYICMHACMHKCLPLRARTHTNARGATVCDSIAAAQPATAPHARSRRGPRATRLPHRETCSMSGETQGQDSDNDRGRDRDGNRDRGRQRGRQRWRTCRCICCRMVVCVLDRRRVMVFDTATTTAYTHKPSWT